MTPKSQYIKLIVPDNFSGRLDFFLQKFLPTDLSLSRSKIKRFILSGNVGLGNQYIKDPSKKVKSMEEFWFLVPKPKETTIISQNIDLDIIFEDGDILVVNKPSGMVVHPGAGVSEGTLVNGLLSYCGNTISSVGSYDRPGIVHRIDKLTSGILVVAKTEKAYQGLIPQFANHSIIRRYIAITWGRLKNHFSDDRNSNLTYANDGGQVRMAANIGRHHIDRKRMSIVKEGGKTAISKFREINNFVIDRTVFASLIECELETGRTHQIRVHLSHIGNPIIGDSKYGGKKKLSANSNHKMKAAIEFKRQALHASFLGFKHPVSRKLVKFEVDPPEDFSGLLQNLTISDNS